MTREELDKVLENHQHWLRENVEGWLTADDVIARIEEKRE